MTGFVFVGGAGRSGTSFFANALGQHPDVARIEKVETKLFIAPGGLLDLHAVLVGTYSPGRALDAITRFRRLGDALLAGTLGQRALARTGAGAHLSAGIDTVTEALAPGGVPRALAAEDFFDCVKPLIRAIRAAALSDSATPNASSALILEKTPHNLLFPAFLDRLAPGARFIHVMRDPRAIACSLRSMSWGPETLDGAALWVTAYCEAWDRSRTSMRKNGLPLLDLYVEDIAVCPEDAASRVTRFLNLTSSKHLFARADPASLQRGITGLSETDSSILQSRLGKLATRTGFDPDRIGLRSGATAAVPA